MTWSYVGGTGNGGSSTSASVTHGLTINADDLVVAYVNVNGPQTITPDDAGWTTALNSVPGSETARHALYWKAAGGSEPATYSFTLGGSDLWQAQVRVYRGSGPPSIDLAAFEHVEGAIADSSIRIRAQDGRTIADNAVSIVCGGKDNRNASDEAYTQVLDASDNDTTGYVSCLGSTGNQATAAAHRIYTTGGTGHDYLFLNTADLNDGCSDLTYSVHISFLEGAASADTATVTVTDQAGGALANQTGITWWWQDSAGANPVDSGNGETTDASGVMVVTLTNTVLNTGQTGYISVELNDGNVGISKEQVD